MISNQDNDLLCRVEGDAPMGKMLRQYWIPACRSESLVSDGEPRRIRLLGENYVAFRATDGKAGFIDEACPHRGCSLVLARNEECGLVCIFHGWKIDTTGSVVDLPTEENRYEFGKKFKTNNYPNREA